MADQGSHMVDRRRFLMWLGGGLLLAGAAALGCGPGPQATTFPLTPGTPLSRVTPTGWRWEIRWIRRPPPVDPQAWRLLIDGLVETSRVLTLDRIKELPATTLRLRMKCVECWSAPADWTGVLGRDLLDLVKPRPEAGYVTLHAIDEYTTNLSLEELRADRVLFVYGMDGVELPAQHGYPLRLIAPSKYGYKSIKGITRLEFVTSRDPGYWEQRGYDNVGTIQPGLDHPLDLGRKAREIQGGEITEY